MLVIKGSGISKNTNANSSISAGKNDYNLSSDKDK
jgi:hypothetical protein